MTQLMSSASSSLWHIAASFLSLIYTIWLVWGEAAAVGITLASEARLCFKWAKENAINAVMHGWLNEFPAIFRNADAETTLWSNSLPSAPLANMASSNIGTPCISIISLASGFQKLHMLLYRHSCVPPLSWISFHWIRCSNWETVLISQSVSEVLGFGWTENPNYRSLRSQPEWTSVFKFCLIVLLTWKEWTAELKLEWNWKRGEEVFSTRFWSPNSKISFCNGDYSGYLWILMEILVVIFLLIDFFGWNLFESIS